MSFSKSFAKNIEGSNYPKWIEVFLDSVEEKEAERLCRSDNILIMKECIEDAKSIFVDITNVFAAILKFLNYNYVIFL